MGERRKVEKNKIGVKKMRKYVCKKRNTEF
jgi:hypothetical protein